MSSQGYLEAVDDGLAARPVGSWTQEKLDYLARYIDIFTTSMREKAFRALHYIDLFSGPGKCRQRESGAVCLGSPLLALNAKHPFTRLFFVDLEPANVSALRQRCASSPLADRVSTQAGDGNTLVHDIVDEIGQIDAPYKAGVWTSLNLAFLDPEGLELEWSSIETLARVKRMDLIVFYPESALNRCCPEALQQSQDTAVDRFFGDRVWRTIYGDPGRSASLHRLLLDHLKANLEKLGYADVKSTAEPLIRNQEKNAPMYRLVFASKHKLGNEFWRAVLSRDVYGQRRLLETESPY